VTPEMVAAMKPGSVIVDLAVEQGGNCPLSHADKSIVTDNGVIIAGFSNLPGRLAADSSALYAKNILNLLPLLADKDSAGFSPAFDDEIIKGMLLTRDGAIVHPALLPAMATT
jgi:H+-translocating NAD(P) transhydrogenase subunit alpha